MVFITKTAAEIKKKITYRNFGPNNMLQYSQLEMRACNCHANAASHRLMHRLTSWSVSYHHIASKRRRNQPARSQVAEPNWDEEMTLFRKRVNSPNQLETLRKIEAEVSVGKVS